MPTTGLDRWRDYLKSHDTNALWELLHPDAVFESPVVHTPQRGRDITFKYLTSAGTVLGGPGFRYVGEWRSDINAAAVVIEGQVDGDIHGDDYVELAKSAVVRGNIYSPRIKMADGARFNGSIDMGNQAKLSVADDPAKLSRLRREAEALGVGVHAHPVERGDGVGRRVLDPARGIDEASIFVIRAEVAGDADRGRLEVRVVVVGFRVASALFASRVAHGPTIARDVRTPTPVYIPCMTNGRAASNVAHVATRCGSDDDTTTCASSPT